MRVDDDDEEEEEGDNDDAEEEEDDCDEGENVNQHTKESATAKLLENIFPTAPTCMKELLLVQARHLGTAPTGRCWSNKMIRTCLRLWSTSPKTYN